MDANDFLTWPASPVTKRGNYWNFADINLITQTRLPTFYFLSDSADDARKVGGSGEFSLWIIRTPAGPTYGGYYMNDVPGDPITSHHWCTNYLGWWDVWLPRALPWALTGIGAAEVDDYAGLFAMNRQITWSMPRMVCRTRFSS